MSPQFMFTVIYGFVDYSTHEHNEVIILATHMQTFY